MMAYAKVMQIETKKLKLKLNSDNVESSIPYYYLSSYTPSIGDIVLVDTNLHIVIGKVAL